METTRIPLSQCVESSYQNRKELGDVSGLARSIEVNGQITPLIVVADGEAYQLVAGHRRTAAMRSLGLVEADAYVMDGWDDARIAQILNAENNHRKELTEAERGRGIQTMLSLGVPVADAAVSADIPEDKAESYVRGTKVVPVDAVNLDFEAVALMGEYDDVLTEDDVVAVLSKKSHWDRQAVCRKARARAAAEEEAARLESLGVKVVDADSLGEGYHGCNGECGHPGLVAVVKPQAWGEGADVTFYCDDESHDYQPTPEEIAETEAYLGRKATLEAMDGRIAEFAKSIYPKFPAKGQSKLRQWAHETFEACYECEPDDAWEGFKEPRGKARPVHPDAHHPGLRAQPPRPHPQVRIRALVLRRGRSARFRLLHGRCAHARGIRALRGGARPDGPPPRDLRRRGRGRDLRRRRRRGRCA